MGFLTVPFYLLDEIPVFSSTERRMASVSPIASIVTVLPVMSSISSNFRIAAISFVFSGIAACIMTRFVAAFMAFKIYRFFILYLFRDRPQCFPVNNDIYPPGA